MDEDDYDWWTATDRETERERIEAYAELQRDKIAKNECHVWRPGFQRRSATVEWLEVCQGLAQLQRRYKGHKGPYPKEMAVRALLLVWPALVSLTGRLSIPKTRKQRQKLRRELGPTLLFFSMMLSNNAPSRQGFNIPIIEIRSRKTTERFESGVKEDSEQELDYEAEVIGREVVREYRRYPDRHNLDAAFVTISHLKDVDGVPTKKKSNVIERYRRYRRLAEKRGYADSRSYWAEIEQRPWPDDHVWLADFPPK